MEEKILPTWSFGKNQKSRIAVTFSSVSGFMPATAAIAAIFVLPECGIFFCIHRYFNVSR